MCALQNYIEELKTKVEEKKKIHGILSDIEIIRLIYIDLGHKLNFNVKYTFGNSKQRKQIYSNPMNDENLDKALETGIIICKSSAYIMNMILQSFGYKGTIVTEPNEYGIIKNGAHVYNLVTLGNNQTYVLDLEEDLEYIQTGAKTRYFFLKNHSDTISAVDEKLLRSIDENVVKYIPDGLYFDDIIWMLEKAISNVNISEDDRFKFILDNLNKYKDISKIGYRERILFYQRVIHHFYSSRFTTGTKRCSLISKIEMYDSYRMVNDDKEFVSCIITNFGDEKLYLFNHDRNCYDMIGYEQLKQEVENGLIIPNERRAKQLKRYSSDKASTEPEI